MNAKLLEIRNNLNQALPIGSDINAWALLKILKDHLKTLDSYLVGEENIDEIKKISQLRLETAQKLITRLDITQRHLDDFSGVAADASLRLGLAEQTIEKLKEEVRAFHELGKHHINSYQE